MGTFDTVGISPFRPFTSGSLPRDNKVGRASFANMMQVATAMKIENGRTKAWQDTRKCGVRCAPLPESPAGTQDM